jgi:hypothetical protein
VRTCLKKKKKTKLKNPNQTKQKNLKIKPQKYCMVKLEIWISCSSLSCCGICGSIKGILFVCLFLFLVFWERASPCSSGWPWVQGQGQGGCCLHLMITGIIGLQGQLFEQLQINGRTNFVVPKSCTHILVFYFHLEE